MSYIDVIERGDCKGIRIYSDVDGVLLPFHLGVANRLGDTEKSILIKSNVDPLASYTKNVLFFSDIISGVSSISKKSELDFVYLSGWRSDAVTILDDLLDIESRGFLAWPNISHDFQHDHKGNSLRAAESLIDDSGLVVWVDDFAIRESIVEDILSIHPGKKVLAIQTVSDVGLTLDQLQEILDFIS